MCATHFTFHAVHMQESMRRPKPVHKGHLKRMPDFCWKSSKSMALPSCAAVVGTSKSGIKLTPYRVPLSRAKKLSLKVVI